MVRLTDRPDMTLDVYRGRKTTIQQQQQQQQHRPTNIISESDTVHFKRLILRWFVKLSGNATLSFSFLTLLKNFFVGPLKERICFKLSIKSGSLSRGSIIQGSQHEVIGVEFHSGKT